MDPHTINTASTPSPIVPEQKSHKPFLVTVVVVLILGAVALLYTYIEKQKIEDQEKAITQRASQELQAKRDRVAANATTTAAAQKNQPEATGSDENIDTIESDLGSMDMNMSADINTFESSTR